MIPLFAIVLSKVIFFCQNLLENTSLPKPKLSKHRKSFSLFHSWYYVCIPDSEMVVGLKTITNSAPPRPHPSLCPLCPSKWSFDPTELTLYLLIIFTHRLKVGWRQARRKPTVCWAFLFCVLDLLPFLSWAGTRAVCVRGKREGKGKKRKGQSWLSQSSLRFPLTQSGTGWIKHHLCCVSFYIAPPLLASLSEAQPYTPYSSGYFNPSSVPPPLSWRRKTDGGK